MAAGKMLLVSVKLAVDPETVAVATGVPLASKVRLVILAGFPVPVTETVKLVRVTAELLGLVNCTC